jgi:predicted CoA-substrate-specific enzyme activase
MIYAGIDAGSRAIQVVLVDGKTLRVAGAGVTDQGIRQGALAGALLDGVLRKAGVARRAVGRIVATGYGRDALTFADTAVTEITCHACGVHRDQPSARTVIDIGGQDSKVLRLDGDGKVRDFVMNDRCAAGTGRFVEVVAARLGVGLGDLGKLAGRSKRPAAISSMCVVFAETEIIGLLTAGEKPANIAAGVLASLATRIAAMAGRNAAEPVVFTGGVALVPGMAQALEAALGHRVRVARRPQFTGALGAALLAERDAEPG